MDQPSQPTTPSTLLIAELRRGESFGTSSMLVDNSAISHSPVDTPTESLDIPYRSNSPIQEHEDSESYQDSSQGICRALIISIYYKGQKMRVEGGQAESLELGDKKHQTAHRVKALLRSLCHSASPSTDPNLVSRNIWIHRNPYAAGK
jgi:hypothetical protein